MSLILPDLATCYSIASGSGPPPGGDITPMVDLLMSMSSVIAMSFININCDYYGILSMWS